MNFFQSGSPYFTHPLLTAERASTEVDAIENILQLSPGASVLDIGCGFGRHSNELARRGFAPVGVDPSKAMIDEAEQRWLAGLANPSRPLSETTPRFEHGTVDDLAATDRFDGAICLFTTLGQVGSDGKDNTALASGTSSRLQEKGKAIFEVPNKQHAISNLVTEDYFETETGSTTISRTVDHEASRINERFVLIYDGKQATYDLSYRVLDPQGLLELLTASGFDSANTFPTLASASKHTTSQETSDRPSHSDGPSRRLQLVTDDDQSIVAVATTANQA